MEKIIIIMLLSIFTIYVGLNIFHTATTTFETEHEIKMEKQAVNLIKESVTNMFYQPNSAIDMVRIPDNVYLRIYSNNSKLYIESKYYYEVVPNVDMDNVVITNGGTLIIKRIAFDNSTNTLKIQITK